MRLRTVIASFLLVFSVLASSQAITFTFVPTSIAGGGTFTAEVTFNDSVIGAGFVNQNPTAFTASLTGNSLTIAPDKSWELDEILFSQFQVTSGRVLTYNALQVNDLDVGGLGAYLLGGATGFSSPTTIGGSWVEKIATAPVPEALSGAFAMGILALTALGGNLFRAKH